MAAKINNYSSIADMQNFWLSDIATQYFNFEEMNLYKIGLFGYVNEVMATVTADCFNAVNIAKREFYSATAQNIASYYKMAGQYGIPLPMATPARCTLALFIPESVIIANSTVQNGTYTFILDNTLEIMVDTKQFTLDYPIRILAKYFNGSYSYTTYFDTSLYNSIADKSIKYLQNKVIPIEGRNHLVISVMTQQYSVTTDYKPLTRNGSIESVSVIFDYSGELAGFDIYYTEEPGISVEKYIPKFSIHEATPNSEYCIYELLSDNKIKITFPKNAYFAPKLNSEVSCKIYTTLGADGNFDEFLSDLNISTNSEKYPYNNGINIRGIVNGSATKGADKKSDEEFIQLIKDAVCTNNTISNAADLQIFFNSLVHDKSLRVEFSKQRDDALERIYNSFILLKDSAENVIPTNTCNLYIGKNNFDVYSDGRGVIKPGKVFKYTVQDSAGVELAPYTLVEDLPSETSNTVYNKNTEFLFTNPFLINVSVDNGIVGYYGNAISEIKETEFYYVEDRSFNQFICLGVQVERNPIAGENYYTFTTKISSSSELDPSEILVMPNPEIDVIRAKHDGRVSKTFFENGAVFYEIEYDIDDESEKYENIQISTYSTKNESGEFEYHIGYDMNFFMLDTFIEGDIIATKKVTDLGKIRGSVDINSNLGNSGMYIPMYVEGYDEESQAYTLRGYVSTNDYISLNGYMTLDHGIYNFDATVNDFVSVPMEDIVCIVSIFYKDDTINYRHDFSLFDFFKGYTMTNQYRTISSDKISLIKGINFIKSNLTFTDGYGYDTVVAPYDGKVKQLVEENNNIYAIIEYNIPATVNDESLNEEENTELPEDEGENTDSTEINDEINEDYTKIMIKRGTLTAEGNVSYTKVYEMNFDIGDSFVATNVICSKKMLETDETNFNMKITSTPLVKSNWIKDSDHYKLFINKMYDIYDALFEAYFALENQYGISMSLFNTYGRSVRYEIGNTRHMEALANINCSMSVGLELNAMTNTAIFIDKFRKYIKEKIESFNDLNENGKSLYIIDLLASAKEEFTEIIHIEYYGFNEYGSEAQVIAPKEVGIVTSDYVKKYVPEFINIYSYKSNGVDTPKIDIQLINYTALS